MRAMPHHRPLGLTCWYLPPGGVTCEALSSCRRCACALTGQYTHALESPTPPCLLLRSSPVSHAGAAPLTYIAAHVIVPAGATVLTPVWPAAAVFARARVGDESVTDAPPPPLYFLYRIHRRPSKLAGQITTTSTPRFRRDADRTPALCVRVAERSGAGTAYTRSRTEFASAI